MGYLNISITMNVYTPHVGLTDVAEELKRIEEFR